MDKLTGDLAAIILNKKITTDTISLAVYNKAGALFFITRNMNDPEWFMNFTVPTIETVKHMCEVGLGESAPGFPAKWIKPILVRNEKTMKHIVKTTLETNLPGLSYNLLYIYGQGDATPPEFAEIRGCKDTTPTEDAREIAVRKYYKDSHHGCIDPQYNDAEDLNSVINNQFKLLFDVIRVLVAEA